MFHNTSFIVFIRACHVVVVTAGDTILYSCSNTCAKILHKGTWRLPSSSCWGRTGLCGLRSLWRPTSCNRPETLHSPEIVFHLVPLPKPAQPPKNEWKDKQWQDDSCKNKQWNKWPPYHAKKNKGKGKGVRSNWRRRSSSTKTASAVDHGRRLCFFFCWMLLERDKGLGWIALQSAKVSGQVRTYQTNFKNIQTN